jgi:hypothetical protein
MKNRIIILMGGRWKMEKLNSIADLTISFNDA